MTSLIRHCLLAATSSCLAATGVAAAPNCRGDGRACLQAVARSYIDALVAHDGSRIPLAATVRRSENALTNARGADEVRESFARTTMVTGARDVRLFVDASKGEVIALFLLDVDLTRSNGAGDTGTTAGKTRYQVAVTKGPGTYTVHEAERFRISHGLIQEIEIIAHVEDGKGLGSGWPVERLKVEGKAQ